MGKCPYTSEKEGDIGGRNEQCVLCCDRKGGRRPAGDRRPVKDAHDRRQKSGAGDRHPIGRSGAGVSGRLRGGADRVRRHRSSPHGCAGGGRVQDDGAGDRRALGKAGRPDRQGHQGVPDGERCGYRQRFAGGAGRRRNAGGGGHCRRRVPAVRELGRRRTGMAAGRLGVHPQLVCSDLRCAVL